MAKIETRKNSDGSFSYRVQIRKKGHEISKTFSNEEDAELYAFYKERLIDNMENFDVPIEKRLTLEQIFELKIESTPEHNKKEINDLENSLKKIQSVLGENRFLDSIKSEEWLEAAKILYSIPVYKGAKSERGKRQMAPKTLKKIFAYLSACISFIQAKGIPIENPATRILQSYINPMLKT